MACSVACHRIRAVEWGRLGVGAEVERARRLRRRPGLVCARNTSHCGIREGGMKRVTRGTMSMRAGIPLYTLRPRLVPQNTGPRNTNSSSFFSLGASS